MMQLWPLKGIAEVVPGDDIAALIVAALEENQLQLEAGDIIAIAQKIISKAEGRYRYLDEVEPEKRAKYLAGQCDKDPRLMQLICDESSDVLRIRKGVIIVQHRLGYVHANAGIDKSNLPVSERERVLLLPENLDASSQAIRQKLEHKYQVPLGVLINDSARLAWSNVTIGFAIVTAGFQPLNNLIGQLDRNGRQLEVSEVAVADELAAAASYMMGQADESYPVVLIRGANAKLGDYPSDSLIRDKQIDLFR